MDLAEVVNSRFDAILPEPPARGPEETIGRTAVPTLAAEGIPASEGEESRPRELPKISVELRGTLSRPDVEESGPIERVDRDLEVLSTLGEGGMGRVFLARQHSLDRVVAIKTVRDRASERERAALLSEGAITGHLEHPGVIPVHALGVDVAGRPLLVMKRVEGVEWAELLAEGDHALSRKGHGGDRLDENLEILMQVCNAAHFAHSRGIVHCDIKPQNVLIGRYGEVYLSDWGLASRVANGAESLPLCGTPSYMPPEMALGGAVDVRTDVYLLGATLHQILTGRPRHSGTNVKDTVLAAAVSAPVDYAPSVPTELAALANAATSADPADRPANAAKLRDAIADYLRHKGSIALGHSAAERLAKLRELSDDPEARADEARRHEIDILAAETGFALAEALREWGENPVALKAKTELEALLAARRARAAELERLAREIDPGVSQRQRALTLGAIALVGIGLSLSSVLLDRRDVTPRTLFYESLPAPGVVGLMFVLLRRHLLATTLNRRTVVALAVAVTGVTVSRALDLVIGTSAPRMLVHDLVMMAAVNLVCAAFLFRWIAWTSLVMLAAAVFAALVPADAFRIFSLGTGVALIVIVGFAWKGGN